MTEPESKNGKEKKRRKKRKHQHRPGQGRTLCNGKPEEEAVPGRRDTGVVVEGIHFFSECFVPILGSPAECRVRPRPASSAFRPNGHPCNWSCRRCCSLLNPCVFSFPPEALLVLAAGCWLLAAAWLLGCLAAWLLPVALLALLALGIYEDSIHPQNSCRHTNAAWGNAGRTRVSQSKSRTLRVRPAEDRRQRSAAR